MKRDENWVNVVWSSSILGKRSLLWDFFFQNSILLKATLKLQKKQREKKPYSKLESINRIEHIIPYIIWTFVKRIMFNMVWSVFEIDIHFVALAI